jgi:hypothetical protein
MVSTLMLSLMMGRLLVICSVRKLLGECEDALGTVNDSEPGAGGVCKGLGVLRSYVITRISFFQACLSDRPCRAVRSVPDGHVFLCIHRVSGVFC